MRILLILVAAAIIIAGGFWVSRQDPDAERARIMAAAEVAASRVGVQKMLRAQDAFDFSNVVITRDPESDGFEFRAMSFSQGAARPVYGQARTDCGDGLDRAECWRIALLEIDGREYALARVPGADPESGQGNGAQPTASGSDVAASPSVPTPAEPAPPAAATVQPASTEPAETAGAEPTESTATAGPAGPSTTHRVNRPVVNARSGPGTNNPVVTRLNNGTALAQISQAEGWGQFMVLSGESEGQVVWVAFSIVSPVGS